MLEYEGNYANEQNQEDHKRCIFQHSELGHLSVLRGALEWRLRPPENGASEQRGEMSASPQPVTACEERSRTPRGVATPPSAPRSPAPAHAVLATMTPVQPAHDYYPHKVEMDSDDGYPEAHSYRHSPHELAAYAPDNKVAVQPDVYDQGMESIDEKTPIDLIYEDDKETVIYTTTPDQKRVEMISGQLEDGQLVSGAGQLVDGGVSVVVGAPGQGTVLVLADEHGQVITIPR